MTLNPKQFALYHGATVKANRDGEFLSDGTALHEHLKYRGLCGYKNSGGNTVRLQYGTQKQLRLPDLL